LFPLLLAGNRAVLLRPKMQKAQGVIHDLLDAVPTDVALACISVDPEPDLTTERAPDPGDRFPWNLPSQRTGLRLLAGDLRLLQDPVMRFRVMSPGP
jgi:hypothetical protein